MDIQGEWEFRGMGIHRKVQREKIPPSNWGNCFTVVDHCDAG